MIFTERKDQGGAVFVFWVCCYGFCDKALRLETPSPQLRSQGSVLPHPPRSTRRGQYRDFPGVSSPALRGAPGGVLVLPPAPLTPPGTPGLGLALGTTIPRTSFCSPGRESSGRVEAPRSPRIPSAGTVPGTSDFLPTARPASEAPVLLSPPPPPLHALGEADLCTQCSLLPGALPKKTQAATGAPAPAWGPVRKSLVHSGWLCRTLPPDHPQGHRLPSPSSEGRSCVFAHQQAPAIAKSQQTPFL